MTLGMPEFLLKGTGGFGGFVFDTLPASISSILAWAKAGAGSPTAINPVSTEGLSEKLSCVGLSDGVGSLQTTALTQRQQRKPEEVLFTAVSKCC